METGAAASALTVQGMVSKLVQRGLSPVAADGAVAGLGLTVHDVTFSLAVEAGAMFPLTRRFGLSHGERACLALDRSLNALVLTVDKA